MHEAESLVTAERKQRTEARGDWIARHSPFGIDRDAFREQLADALAIGKIAIHEGSGADVDDERIARGGKPECDRIGAERAAYAARRGDMRLRAYGVQADEPGARDHFHVVGAAAAGPAVHHAHD